jgi:hypothetical protein
VLNASRIEPVYEDPGVFSVIADVSDPDGARRLVDEAVDRLGKLDILVNNAGVELEATIEHTSPEEWDRVMAVNARGPFLCAKFALPHLRRARGVIVNIASVDAFWGEPELAAYCASRGAVLGAHTLPRARPRRRRHQGGRDLPGLRPHRPARTVLRQPTRPGGGAHLATQKHPLGPHMRARRSRKPGDLARIGRSRLRFGPALHHRRGADRRPQYGWAGSPEG